MRNWWKLTIRLTEEEQSAFAAQASAEGLSLEEWLKQAGRDRLAHPPRPRPAPRPRSLLELYEPLRELETELSLDPRPKKAVEREGAGDESARKPAQR